MNGEAQIKRVMKKVRHLIEVLWSDKTSVSESDEEGGGPFVAFVEARLGGLQLSGAEADLFYECHSALQSLHAGNPELSVLSKEAARRLLQTAVLEALRVKQDQIGRTGEPLRVGATEHFVSFAANYRRRLPCGKSPSRFEDSSSTPFPLHSAACTSRRTPKRSELASREPSGA